MKEEAFDIVHPERKAAGRIRAVVFDFDGTFSTLRCGWEKVMRPLMLEMISGGPAEEASEELRQEVDAYIDESTGIQTVYQMMWLRDRVEQEGRGASDRDEWWYKEAYNKRLMEQVQRRLDRLECGQDMPEQYLISGAVSFIRALKEHGVRLYLASGTDHEDVIREAEALGVAKYFTKIKGAPSHMAACSKEAVIRMILEEEHVSGEEMLLVGDGKVEIALGREVGAFTLGVATDEEARHGLNSVKYKRLKKAGADVITGDFTRLNALLSWLGFEEAFNQRTRTMVDDFFTLHSEILCLRAEAERAIMRWVHTFDAGNKLLLCGNGGSAADCDHIAGELLKGFLLKRPLDQTLRKKLEDLYGEDGEKLGKALQQGLPAISLVNHGAAISAFANDVDAEYVYAEQVTAYGKKGDTLVGISTSGNAKNVDAAVKTARAFGLHTIGLSGKGGGKLKERCDICLTVPEEETYRIQEYHLMLYHLLCAGAESEIFRE